MKKLILLPVLFLFAACSIQGLTNDFSKLSAEQKSRITPLSDFAQAQEGNIYEVNGAQLRAELEKHPKAMVYVFTNGCTSKYCKPLRIYEIYAKDHGYDLFLVMNGYRDLGATLEQPVNSPLFAIDNGYYNSKYRARYTTYFTNDMTGKPIKEKEGDFLGNLYFFNKGKLDKILNDLPPG
jgi:hypothetical protein